LCARWRFSIRGYDFSERIFSGQSDLTNARAHQGVFDFFQMNEISGAT
jgi:hypothetical protein